jgi:hypothetical protein
MSIIFDRLDKKAAKEAGVLRDFIAVYCRERHKAEEKTPFTVKDERLRDALGDRDITLCKECSRLLNHGIAKLLLCPYDPKPTCRKCPTHCYAPGYRERVREVMRFSGPYFVRRGRLHYLLHYLQ